MPITTYFSGTALDTLAQARPALVILIVAVLAALALRHLLSRALGRRDSARRWTQTSLLILALTLSAALITASAGVGDSGQASFRANVTRNLGAIDETVVGATTARGNTPRYVPATMADTLRGALSTEPSVAGVTGAIMQPVAFQDRATRRTATDVELLGVPAAYPTVFGPLTTVQGAAAPLDQVGADQVYINEAAARVLGARAGDRLQLVIAGPSAARRTTLYFAEGYTGQFRTNGQATFEETLVLRNITPLPATATLTYLVQDAGPLVVTRVIPPHATLRESVNRDIGPDHSVAAIVSSLAPLTVERLMSRLNAFGTAFGATRVAGISTVGTVLSFAPSQLGRSDQVYVALVNPGPVAARVRATFTAYARSSTGAATRSVTVPARSRATLHLAHLLGNLRVTSDQPIIAEQTRYTGAGNGSAKSYWSVTPGVPPAPRAGTARTQAIHIYAPVVRAVLRDQGLAAGGLRSSGAWTEPLALLPLQRARQALGQSGGCTPKK